MPVLCFEGYMSLSVWMANAQMLAFAAHVI